MIEFVIIDAIFGKGGERANYFRESERERGRGGEKGRESERERQKHKLVISLSERERASETISTLPPTHTHTLKHNKNPMES